jgi:hypothetical protein
LQCYLGIDSCASPIPSSIRTIAFIETTAWHNSDRIAQKKRQENKKVMPYNNTMIANYWEMRLLDALALG